MRYLRNSFAVLVVLGLLASACAVPDGEVAASGGNYCVEEAPREIDFSVLNDAYQAIADHSIYFDEDKVNVRSLYAGVEEAFWGSLGVRAGAIPAWSHELIEAQLAIGVIDFSVIQQIFAQAAQDDRYARLRDPRFQSSLLEIAINGFINALKDPFANYTPAENLGASGTSLEGGYVGFGFQLDHNDRNEFVISSVFAGQPAELAGLRAGDVILAVDDKSVDTCSQGALMQNLIGPEGSSITMTVKRLSGEVADLLMTRGRVKQLDVTSWPGAELNGGRGSTADELPFAAPLRDREGNEATGIAYIRFRSFTIQGGQDLIETLRQMPPSAYANGIVLDLRGNGGGLLNVADWLAGLFYLDSAPFFVETRRQGNRPYSTSNILTLAGQVPLVVLVGRDPYDQRGSSDNSYSASELIASTFKDNQRALLIGESVTGGKGTINNHIPLRDGEYGEIYIAIGFFSGNDGTPIQGEDLDGDDFYDTGGVAPHIIVEWTDEDFSMARRNPNWDPVLFRAIEALRAGEAV